MMGVIDYTSGVIYSGSLFLLTSIAATGVAAHDELFIAKEKHMERLLNQCVERRHFIGGSDARIIMGQDEKALVRLWQEKRGEVGPEDLSTNLIVQLGLATTGGARGAASQAFASLVCRSSLRLPGQESPTWRL